MTFLLSLFIEMVMGHKLSRVGQGNIGLWTTSGNISQAWLVQWKKLLLWFAEKDNNNKIYLSMFTADEYSVNFPCF